MPIFFCSVVLLCFAFRVVVGRESMAALPPLKKNGGLSVRPPSRARVREEPALPTRVGVPPLRLLFLAAARHSQQHSPMRPIHTIIPWFVLFSSSRGAARSLRPLARRLGGGDDEGADVVARGLVVLGVGPVAKGEGARQPVIVVCHMREHFGRYGSRSATPSFPLYCVHPSAGPPHSTHMLRTSSGKRPSCPQV